MTLGFIIFIFFTLYWGVMRTRFLIYWVEVELHDSPQFFIMFLFFAPPPHRHIKHPHRIKTTHRTRAFSLAIMYSSRLISLLPGQLLTRSRVQFQNQVLVYNSPGIEMRAAYCPWFVPCTWSFARKSCTESHLQGWTCASPRTCHTWKLPIGFETEEWIWIWWERNGQVKKRNIPYFDFNAYQEKSDRWNCMVISLHFPTMVRIIHFLIGGKVTCGSLRIFRHVLFCAFLFFY